MSKEAFAEAARRIELASSLRSVPRYDVTTAKLIRLALAHVPASDHLWSRGAPSRSEPGAASNSDLTLALQKYGYGHAADEAAGRVGPGMAEGLRRAGVGMDYRKNPRSSTSASGWTKEGSKYVKRTREVSPAPPLTTYDMRYVVFQERSGGPWRAKQEYVAVAGHSKGATGSNWVTGGAGAKTLRDAKAQVDATIRQSTKANPDSWVVVHDKEVYDPLAHSSTRGPFYSKKKAKALAKREGGTLMGKREHHKWHGRGRPEMVTYFKSPPPAASKARSFQNVIVDEIDASGQSTGKWQRFANRKEAQHFVEDSYSWDQEVGDNRYRWKIRRSPSLPNPRRR